MSGRRFDCLDPLTKWDGQKGRRVHLSVNGGAARVLWPLTNGSVKRPEFEIWESQYWPEISKAGLESFVRPVQWLKTKLVPWRSRLRCSACSTNSWMLSRSAHCDSMYSRHLLSASTISAGDNNAWICSELISLWLSLLHVDLMLSAFRPLFARRLVPSHPPILARLHSTRPYNFPFDRTVSQVSFSSFSGFFPAYG